MKYPEYEATQIAQDQFLWYDYNNLEIPGKEYIQALEKASPFADKLRERAYEMGYSGNPSDAESLRSFLFQLLQKEKGIIDESNARVWKANLKNWLIPQKDNPAPLMPGKRESVYQLCFALRMNALEAGEFFVKGYLERPYNFKDLKETVYFYCLNNGLRYVDAVALYQTAQAIPFEENAYAETDTAAIGHMVNEFRDDEAFLDYVRLNRWSFETKSMSARNMISQLIEQCLPYATKESNDFNFSDRQEAIAERDKRVEDDDGTEKTPDFKIHEVVPVNIKKTARLLSVIYGYSAREERTEKENKGCEKKKKPNKIYVRTLNTASLFPKLIREKMVANTTQLSQLQKGTAPDAITRSALILFNFYHFYSSAGESSCANIIHLFDEFVDETDSILLECGHGQLYWRNPYDWMIGYCAMSTNPINELRLLIDEFFLDDESVIHQ